MQARPDAIYALFQEVLLHVGRPDDAFMDGQGLVAAGPPAGSQVRPGEDGDGIDTGQVRLELADSRRGPDQARPVFTGQAGHELMADGEAVLPQESRRRHDIP